MAYNSGVQLPQVEFSTIDNTEIPVGSYFVGFDLDNDGKLSKMDNTGTITVIEGGSGGYAYEIGQYVEDQGGVIFHRYIDGTNQHYLVVSIADQSTSQVWSNVDNILVPTYAQSTWNGSSNSDAIVLQPGHINSAASICSNYSIGSVTDWYLPAIDQLSLLWQNRFNVNRTLQGASSAGSISGAQILSPEPYWSSTEFGNDVAWYFDFLYGDASSNLKSGTTYVRAIRQFVLPI